MGKNQRHKKTIRSEKSKTQFKAKSTTKNKILPKGTNVTDTNFKIKPIVILEQLKLKTGEEPLSKKKLSLKELIIRLNHHNTNVKCEACQGISELIIDSSVDVIEQNLYALLQGIGKLVLDEESKVRQKAIKLISDILENVNRDKLAPFLDILATYATCAMTALNKNIQEDSLLLIDAFLKYSPQLLVNNFKKMLTNFLTLISKLKSDSKLSRTLTMHLKSHITTIKWRINVLSRLNGILKTFLYKQGRSKEQESGLKIVHVQDMKSSYIPLHKPIQNFDLTLLDLIGDTQKETTEDHITQYVTVLIPLLYDTWAEAVPIDEMKYFENKATVIEQDSATILCFITEILYSLWELVQLDKNTNVNKRKQLFLSKTNSKLLDYLLNQFPYQQRDMHRPKANKNMSTLNTSIEANTDPRCVKENLEICYMFCVLHKTLPKVQYVVKAHQVVEYLNACLSNRNYIAFENVKILTSVLQVILLDNYRSWNQDINTVGSLFDSTVRFYDTIDRNHETKVDVFQLLCDLVHVPQTSESQRYSNWLSSLPQLLCSSKISEKIVDMLLVLCKQNNPSFQDALLEHLPSVLENLGTIQLQSSSYPAYVKVISMFYYIPNLRENHLVHLKRFIDKNEGSKVAIYLQQILKERNPPIAEGLMQKLKKNSS